MATLVQSASRARRFIVIGVLILAAILVIDFGGRFLNSPANPFAAIPSFYLTANNALGQVPVPVIQSMPIAADSTPNFTRQIGKNFPRFPETTLVYQISEPRISFDTTDKAVQTAGVLGFSGQYQEIRPNVLRWQNSTGTRVLEVDNNTAKWQLRTQYFFDTIALLPKEINTNPSFYQQRGISLISQLGFKDDTFSDPQTTATYAKLGSDGLFTNPVNASSADYIVLDVYRTLNASALKTEAQLTEIQKQVTNKPEATRGKIYKQDPRQGSVRMVVSDDAAVNEDVYNVDHYSFRYNTTNTGIYALITAEQAYERMQRGENSALVLLQLQTDDYFAASKILSVTGFEVDPTQTELGYFEATTYEPFAYPIYVFRGTAQTKDRRTARFVYYVDALQRLAPNSSSSTTPSSSTSTSSRSSVSSSSTTNSRSTSAN